MSARKSSQRNLQGRTGNNILVLCYGNIYRSPFVEKRLRELLQADQFSVKSAGFYHATGRPCDPEYVLLAEETGISLSGHRSGKVSIADLTWADVIVIMDRKNWDALRDMGVAVGQKIVWIGCYLEKGLPEISDPYGLSEPGVRRTLQKLDESTERMVEALCRYPSC